MLIAVWGRDSPPMLFWPRSEEYFLGKMKQSMPETRDCPFSEKGVFLDCQGAFPFTGSQDKRKRGLEPVESFWVVAEGKAARAWLGLSPCPIVSL